MYMDVTMYMYIYDIWISIYILPYIGAALMYVYICMYIYVYI